MLNFLEKFQNKFYTKKLKIDVKELSKIIALNRISLNEVPNWMDEQAISEAVFRYGIPTYIDDKLNLPINSEITYSDVICHFYELLNKPVNYLEIGVSVGKNIYQLLNYFNNSNLMAFDIEKINPVLESKLNFNKEEKWPTFSDSIKKDSSSLKEYTYKTNSFQYINGDEWDANSWEKLSGKKFNIIFSDALHEPEALIYEYEMIKKFKLLDDKFLMIWDDLGGSMTDSFRKIFKDMCSSYKLKKENCYLVPLNGWLGEHESKHQIGIITNIL